MKIALLHDVPKVGKKYDVKNVSDGFALNFLIPKGLASTATDTVIKKLETLKAEDSTRRKIQEDLLLMNLKTIDGMELLLSERANEKGHLFAGIHKQNIIAGMADKHINLHPDFILLEKPIKQLGEHTVEINVQNKKATLKVIVSAA